MSPTTNMSMNVVIILVLNMIVLRYVGSGKYSDVFKIHHKTCPVILKVSYYRDTTLNGFSACIRSMKYQEAKRIKRRDAIAIASQMGTIGNAFVQQRISPHFVILYGDIDCKNFAEHIRHVIPHRKMSPIQMKYNNLTFLEVFDTDLTRYLMRTQVTDGALCAILFHVLYTLAALQHKYPGFRHNDLSTNNVLVKKTQHTASYSVGGTLKKTFYTTTPILVALADYDFTHIPETMNNERIDSGHYKIDSKSNPSYDTHFFLKSVAKCLGLRGNAAPKTRAFLRSLKMLAQDRLSVCLDALVPHQVLQHTYFSALQKPIKGVYETYTF